MGTLKNTHINPEIVESKLVQKEVNDRGTKALISSLTERLRKWKEFSGTEEGEIVEQLAGPEITVLNYRLGLSSMVIVQGHKVAPENVDELRAEWRGERRIWTRLKYAKDQLEARLKELGVDGEDEISKAKWRKLSRKDKKKFLTETK